MPDDEIHVGILSLEESLKITGSVGDALSRVKCSLHTYVHGASEGWGVYRGRSPRVSIDNVAAYIMNCFPPKCEIDSSPK